MRTERLAITSPEINEGIQPVVRVFPFSPINVDEVLKKIHNNKLDNTHYLPIVNTYLAVKSNRSETSPNNIAAIGGKMEDNEDPITAGYREMGEEVTIIPIPCFYDETGFDLTKHSFEYQIKEVGGGINREKRQVHFMTALIMDPEVFVPIYPNQETKSKVHKIIPLTITELAYAMRMGEHTTKHNIRSLEGHIVFKKTPDIVIDDVNLKMKDKLLGVVLNSLFRFETEFKQDLLNKINKLSKQEGYGPSFINERFELQILNMKDLLPVEVFNKIFKEAYLMSIEETSMKYFRQQQIKKIREQRNNKIDFDRTDDKEFNSLKIKAEVIKKSLLDWTFGVEYLHYLQLMVKDRISEKSITTGSIMAFKKFFNSLINNTIKDFSFPGRKNENRQLSLKNFLSSPDINLQKKQDYLRLINENLIHNLAIYFDVAPNDVSEAWTEALRFIPNLAEHINKADPALSQIYQYDELRNEINNASLAKVLLMLQSIDIQNYGENWPILKFEAGRQLLFFLKILFDKPYYQAEIAKIPNPLSEAVNDFFGQVDHIHELDFFLRIRDKQHKFYMQTYDRKTKGAEIVRVDQKPPKPYISFIRKSFETNPSKIKDFYSVNIVLPDEDYKHLSPKERIIHTNRLLAQFTTFIREQYPSYKLEVSHSDTKNTYGNYFKYQAGEEISSSGKRTGSQASRIIRAKTYLRLVHKNDPKKDYTMEMALYPFESLYDPKQSELNQLMGWREKIVDDQRYAVRRMLFPLIEGGQSLLELLFPPFLYPNYIRKLKELVLVPD